MNHKTIWIAIAVLVAFTNTVFAANWVNVGTNSDAMKTMYVDRDSALKVGDTVIFWEAVVMYEPDLNDVKKFLYKKQASKTKMVKQLEEYDYKEDKSLHWSDTRESDWYVYYAGSIEDYVVRAAFKYAKEGRDASQKPSSMP